VTLLTANTGAPKTVVYFGNWGKGLVFRVQVTFVPAAVVVEDGDDAAADDGDDAADDDGDDAADDGDDAAADDGGDAADDAGGVNVLEGGTTFVVICCDTVPL